MEAAERLGISLRRFLGWEPKTVYEHDGDRLVASVPETEWDDTQQGWMLALQVYRSWQCPCGCGHDVRDTTSPERTGPGFTVPPPARCRARDALSMAQDANKNPRPEALLWQVRSM